MSLTGPPGLVGAPGPKGPTGAPTRTDYEHRLDAATQHASQYDHRKIGGVLPWNNHFIAGLFRYGLMLTTNRAHALLIPDERYPNGTPYVAPWPTEDEENLWPEETWIIYNDLFPQPPSD